MNPADLLIAAVCVLVAGVLLWRARKRGCARSQRLEEHREESKRLLREEDERWGDTFGNWPRPHIEDDSPKPRPAKL